MAFSVTTTLSPGTFSFSPKTARLYEDIARAALGKKYDLSLAFVGDARSRRLNRTYRGKDKPTNVLSFPFSKDTGEIVIDVPYAVREASRFGKTPTEHLRALFIHGCVHLAGYDHGPAMDRRERALLSRFSSRQA